MLCIIKLEILISLFSYYYRIKGSQTNVDDAEKNVSLFEMKLAYETFYKEKNEYENNFNITNMTPEININV